MGVIFDTTEIISIERKVSDIEHLVRNRPGEPCAISVITVAELLHGVERADTQAQRLSRQAFVERAIQFFTVIPFEIAMARTYAKLWASLVSQSIVVGTHDLMIAATALSLDYTIITANMRDFGKIEGLKIEKL